MFDTEEQQKKMLESIGTLNENIESFGQSFGEGMKKLDDQADDMLKNMNELKKEFHKLINLPGLLKQIFGDKWKEKK